MINQLDYFDFNLNTASLYPDNWFICTDKIFIIDEKRVSTDDMTIQIKDFEPHHGLTVAAIAAMIVLSYLSQSPQRLLKNHFTITGPSTIIFTKESIFINGNKQKRNN